MSTERSADHALTSGLSTAAAVWRRRPAGRGWHGPCGSWPDPAGERGRPGDPRRLRSQTPPASPWPGRDGWLGASTPGAQVSSRLDIQAHTHTHTHTTRAYFCGWPPAVLGRKRRWPPPEIPTTHSGRPAPGRLPRPETSLDAPPRPPPYPPGPVRIHVQWERG